jgi:two-component system NarL family response regulator
MLTEPATKLTGRELALVQAVARGLTNREIAGEFSLSEQTVKNQLSMVYHKLGMRSRVQLALFAMRNELVGTAATEPADGIFN